MLQRLTFTFLMLAVVRSDGSLLRFDYSFNKDAEGWFKLHQTPSTFHEAFLKCNAEGAVVASPLKKNVFDGMMELVKKNLNQPCGVFTGIHSSITKNAFATIEGTPIERLELQWAQGEPDNHNNNESCVLMLPDGKFADVICNETFPFICYRKKISNPIINECGTDDKEYVLDSRTGSCYKFHRVGRSWKLGYMTCLAEGGYLAIINSEVEAGIISDLFLNNRPETIFSELKDVASIGFYDWSEYRAFFTVHGQTLEQAGYSKFGGSNPDNQRNGDGDAICGGVYRNGRLCDIWCNIDIAPFICEKSPGSLIDDEH